MKMFVVVRNDLTPSQCAVQAGHAVAEYLLNKRTDWTNGTLVYLRIRNESRLKRFMEKLEYNDIDYIVFREPDLNNEITAITSIDNDDMYKRLQLL